MRVATRSAVLPTIALLVIASVGACGARGDVGQRVAIVGYVVDGDTLRLRDGTYVRLVQIDSPERGQECFAEAAARELSRLTPSGARIVLEADPVLDQVDRYGRLLRYVHTSVNVNLVLVRRGAATPYFYEGDRGRHAARLLAAAGEARRERRGMWGACRVSWTPDRQVATRSR